MVSANNLHKLKSGLSPRVSREPSLAHTLVLASGDPEQRAQLSHARLLTYKTVSYEIYVALSHYVCGNMLMAATEMNAQGGSSAFGEGGNLLQPRASAQTHFFPPSLFLLGL